MGATNTAHNPFIFNAAPTLDHLRLLFGRTFFPAWLGNTRLVGVAVVAVTLLTVVIFALTLSIQEFV